MFISYAICTHNEGQYIADLLSKLVTFISINELNTNSEIVVLDDVSTDARTQMILRKFSDDISYVKLSHRKHPGDFSDQKNHLNSLCSGEWIFNIDADEWVTEYFLSIIPKIIELNPEVEAYWIPRVNTVSGLTEEHLKKWGWQYTILEGFQKTEKVEKDSESYKFLKSKNLILAETTDHIVYNPPIIMWPDYQLRLYRNTPEIKWTKPVHEQLVGYKKVSFFPDDPHLAIRHFKTIDRQEAQNASYDAYSKK